MSRPSARAPGPRHAPLTTPDSPEVIQYAKAAPEASQAPANAIRFKCPVRIESEANRRDHWAARHRRFAKQKRVVALHLLALGGMARPRPPLVVELTRIGPRSLDTDNLAGGCKAVRDQIAAWLGVDDGDPRVEWRYGQQRGKPREYALLVEMTEKVQVIYTNRADVGQVSSESQGQKGGRWGMTNNVRPVTRARASRGGCG